MKKRILILWINIRLLIIQKIGIKCLLAEKKLFHEQSQLKKRKLKS